MTDTLSARLRSGDFYIEDVTDAADEIDQLTGEVARLEKAGLEAIDMLDSGRTEMREASVELLKRQGKIKRGDALAEAVRELQKQGRHENGPEPDGNGAYVVSDIDWQEFEAALTAYKEGDS